jgi:hypothetical protein
MASVAAAHAWRAAPFTFRRALVRGLAPNFAEASLRAAGPAVTISQALAERQHADFVEALRALVPDVTVLPPAPGCADSNFIEDTAVVVGGTALITRLGAESRRAETAAVADALAALGLRVVETPASATLDGGDVLFTGRELFVGLGDRTDRGGAEAVRNAFPGVPVTPIPMPGGRFDGAVRDRSRRQARSATRDARDAALLAARTGKVRRPTDGHVHGPGCAPGCSGADDDLGSDEDGPLFHALHLKSLVTMAGPDAVAVADVEEGLAVAELLQSRQKAGRRSWPLRFLVLPDAPAANVVFANGGLLHRSGAAFPESVGLLAGGGLVGVERRIEVRVRFRLCVDGEGAMPPCTQVPAADSPPRLLFLASPRRRAAPAHLLQVDVSELAKADGALSCGAILIH